MESNTKERETSLKICEHSKTNFIHPPQVQNHEKKLKNISNIPNHELQLNLRAMLGAFMISTGGSDVGKLMMMMEERGGSSFERSFYRSANFVH